MGGTSSKTAPCTASVGSCGMHLPKAVQCNLPQSSTTRATAVHASKTPRHPCTVHPLPVRALPCATAPCSSGHRRVGPAPCTDGQGISGTPRCLGALHQLPCSAPTPAHHRCMALPAGRLHFVAWHCLHTTLLITLHSPILTQHSLLVAYAPFSICAVQAARMPLGGGWTIPATPAVDTVGFEHKDSEDSTTKSLSTTTLRSLPKREPCLGATAWRSSTSRGGYTDNPLRHKHHAVPLQLHYTDDR